MLKRQHTKTGGECDYLVLRHGGLGGADVLKHGRQRAQEAAPLFLVGRLQVQAADTERESQAQSHSQNVVAQSQASKRQQNHDKRQAVASHDQASKCQTRRHNHMPGTLKQLT